MGKFWLRKKLANLANRELLTKIFLTNILDQYSQIHQNVFGIWTDCSLFAKFLPHQKLLPVWFSRIFPMCGTNQKYDKIQYLHWMDVKGMFHLGNCNTVL